MINKQELKQLRHIHNGYSINEFKNKLNLSEEQKRLIAEQLLAIKWNFCIGYSDDLSRLKILDEMKLEFGVSETMKELDKFE